MAVGSCCVGRATRIGLSALTVLSYKSSYFYKIIVYLIYNPCCACAPMTKPAQNLIWLLLIENMRPVVLLRPFLPSSHRALNTSLSPCQ